MGIFVTFKERSDGTIKNFDVIGTLSLINVISGHS